MSSVRIARRSGRALPRICWTIAAAQASEVLAQARRASPRAGRLVEVRLDYLDRPEEGAEAIRALRRARIPAVATLRSASAGGRFAGSVEEQLRILERCAKAGAALVDLEIESAEQAGPAALNGLRCCAQLLISFHDFQHTPEQLPAVLKRLSVFPAGFYKIAAMSESHRDNAALLELNGNGPRRAKTRARTPPGRVLAFGMGEIGSPTRVLSVARGAPFAYAALSSGEAVAPGQLTGEELLGRYRVARLSPKTAVYGVIGNPVAHSVSPAVHNAAFAAIRRDAVYLPPFRVESLEDFLAALPAYRLAGFSITIPHKEALAAAVDWVEPEAREVGAVNTVVIRGGQLRAYNTDMPGLVVPLEKRMQLRGARILVAGAGGAARAAAFALARRGARVVIVGRRPEQARALAEAVAGEFIERNVLSGESFHAIVHATPLGMYPDVESCFFGPGELNAPVLLETVYNPIETRLVQMARQRRMKVILGVEMFIEQAVRQFELWTGRKAPRAVMERAALQALGSRAARKAAP